MIQRNDLSYLLHRAEQEAIMAIVVDNTAGGPIHFDLSRHFSRLAVRALASGKVERQVNA